jgi:hypothetical protein
MSVEERWIVFFRYLSDGTQGELLKELIHEEEGIAMARAEVVKIRRNERGLRANTSTNWTAKATWSPPAGKAEPRVSGLV